jgi:hypothetical protein
MDRAGIGAKPMPEESGLAAAPLFVVYGPSIPAQNFPKEPCSEHWSFWHSAEIPARDPAGIRSGISSGIRPEIPG